ncbi:ion transporter [Thalassobaculum sp.]|uniref:ion transporter n=1 Tax=Thalassobaculum sp. TaxID=2022740 RepID=UPI0032EE5F6A
MTAVADPVGRGFWHRAGVWVESPPVQWFVTALIVVNAVILGLETSQTVMAVAGPALLLVDKVILAVFTLEIALRIGHRRLSFFRDGWSVFDFAVVAIALAPVMPGLSVLRALRVLRVLRLITVMPRLKMVVRALLSSLPGLGSIALLQALIFYVAAVIATKLFAADFPDWFGSIGQSLYTLFQVMTLESWSMGIVRPVMEVYPYAWAFFVPFILIATFTMLNLFIAVIVSAMQAIQHDETEAVTQEIRTATHDETETILGELKRLRAEVEALRGTMNVRPAPGD